MRRLLIPFLLIVLLLGLTACQATPAGVAAPRPALSGGIIVWYGTDEADRQIWEAIFDNFTQIYPEVTILADAVPQDELLGRYERTSAMGLGPDLLLGPHDWLMPLADQGLIRPIDEALVAQDSFLSTTMETMRYNGRLYGLPLTLHMNGLYYNASLVETPVTNLDEMLAQAAAGQGTALTTTFDDAFWGIQAFGGQVLDENGAVVLYEGGMANWLAWLKSAQDAPGMFLNRDKTLMRQLFMDGRVAYYVGSPDELPVLQEALGEDNVRVSTLPAGPQGPAGPLLLTHGLFFNHASSAEQVALAGQLAAFMTSVEQSTRLMRDAQVVPANQRVRIDPRLYPVIAGFAVQSRTAVALANTPQSVVVREQGSDVYRLVLEGVVPASDALLTFSQRINESFGLAPAGADGTVVCGGPGTVRLWHTWTGDEENELVQIANLYESLCPDAQIELTAVNLESLSDSLKATAAGELPDLVLAPHYLLPELVAQNLLNPITADVSGSLTQRFMPTTVRAMTLGTELYGLPLAQDVNIFYYNSVRTTDLPSTLAELETQLEANRSLALPVNGLDGYWGISANGGVLLDDQGRILWDPQPLIDWLAGLRQVQDYQGVVLNTSRDLTGALFSSGSSDYFVGRSGDLPVLLSHLGSDALRVSILPAGPGGDARPLLFVDGFMFTGGDKAQVGLALAFVDFATMDERQAELALFAGVLPVHVNVTTQTVPYLETLLKQAQSGVLVLPVFMQPDVLALATDMYQDVLTGRATPIEAACSYILAVNQANGLDVTEADLAAVCQAGAAGAGDNG
ncbi:MAG: extracellular solute-binding protein [Anaerolineales bacterium]|nr:extracellular solute-binding protein [Anaerolineales bacterium]